MLSLGAEDPLMLSATPLTLLFCMPMLICFCTSFAVDKILDLSCPVCWSFAWSLSTDLNSVFHIFFFSDLHKLTLNVDCQFYFFFKQKSFFSVIGKINAVLWNFYLICIYIILMFVPLDCFCLRNNQFYMYNLVYSYA